MDFWAGQPKQQSYFHLYDVTARALKAVNIRLRVGGPATAQAAWIGPFIQHCMQKHIPLDFISTHVYGNDSPQDVLGIDTPVPRTEMVCRAARKVHDEVESLHAGLPIIWSEYNASYKNEPDVTDSLYMGPWLADTIRQCDGLVDMMSYWTFSDVFEEQGVVKTPFYGGFGLLAERGLPKPSFNAFALLHRLGRQRVPLDSTSALLTRRRDGTLVMALWNLTPAEETGKPKVVEIAAKNLTGHGRVLVFRLDSTHGSLLATYQAMGRPAYPTIQQIIELRQAARLPPPKARHFSDGKIQLVLPPDGFALLEFR